MEIKGKLKIQNSGPLGLQKLVMASNLLASNANLFFNIQGDFMEEGEFTLIIPEKQPVIEEKGATTKKRQRFF